MSLVRLTILMGTRNRFELLKRSIDAVTQENVSGHQLVVIDAGSTDNTLASIRSRSDICLVEDGQKLGQARSLNRVAKNCTSPYICWLSDDNVVRPGALRDAVSILDKDPTIGMVSLKVQDVAGSRSGKPYIGAISSAGFVNCNQGVIRTDLFRKIGGFDEEFSDYMMDTDLTAKVLLTGKVVVFTKKIAVEHYREHESDSWITKKERKARLDSRRLMFEQRYSRLIDWVERTQTRVFLEKRIRKVAFLRRLQTMLTRVGFDRYSWNERDWYNLSFALAVSVSDPLSHLFSSFYLRQSLPKTSCLESSVASPAHLNGNRPRREIHVKRWELASQIASARQGRNYPLLNELRRCLDEIDNSLTPFQL